MNTKIINSIKMLLSKKEIKLSKILNDLETSAIENGSSKSKEEDPFKKMNHYIDFLLYNKKALNDFFLKDDYDCYFDSKLNIRSDWEKLSKDFKYRKNKFVNSVTESYFPY